MGAAYPTTVKERLEPLAQSLRADGFDIDVVCEGSSVVVRIVAGPEACEECLVPEEAAFPIVVSALDGLVAEGDIQLSYSAS